jgi:hypothetical protein
MALFDFYFTLILTEGTIQYNIILHEYISKQLLQFHFQ